MSDPLRLIADQVGDLCQRLGIDYVFKARGPGAEEGLAILQEVRERFALPVLTDIHESHQVATAAQVVDVLQIPAYLCRQTHLLQAAAEAVAGSSKGVNVKKGQFLAPWDMAQVVDYRSLPLLQALGFPVIFDATHAVQQPGGLGTSSGGQQEFVAPLARAAVAVGVGVDGLFLEVHPDPDQALSDGPNMVPLHRLEVLLRQLLSIQEVVAGGVAVRSL